MRAQDRTEMKPYERDRLGPQPLIRPDNNEAVRLCVNAWHQLDSARPLGFGAAGAIPYPALVTWAEVNHLDRDNLNLLWSVLHHLDNERAARIDSERKTKGKKR